MNFLYHKDGRPIWWAKKIVYQPQNSQPIELEYWKDRKYKCQMNPKVYNVVEYDMFWGATLTLMKQQDSGDDIVVYPCNVDVRWSIRRG